MPLSARPRLASLTTRGEILNDDDVHFVGSPARMGLIKAGMLADILLVDGDPTLDVSILQDTRRIPVVMKDGKYHRASHVNTLSQ